MPIPRFMLADYDADQLARELVRRIPAHTPDWRNPREGDPGRTLIDLFAWLGETLLYRVNLIPERQWLEFMRLLNIGLEPARPARGLVALGHANPAAAAPEFVPVGTPVAGPAEFETTGPITVQPFEGRVYIKRRPDAEERRRLEPVLASLESIYRIQAADPYITTPLFADGQALPQGVDPLADSVDATLWVALLAPGPRPADRERALAAFERQPALLNVGVVPRLLLPDPDPAAPPPALPELFDWAITGKRRAGGAAEDTYFALAVEQDGTGGLAREGTLRLVLPGRDDIGAPENDLDADLEAGAGERPPRVDEPDIAARLLAWLRLRPKGALGDARLPLSWLGLNAVTVDQRKTLRDILIGVAGGGSDETVALPAAGVDPDSLRLEVYEDGRGFVPWRRVDDLGACGRDERCYALDPEAGTVTFGDGVRGRRPEPGARLRVAWLRAGGGRAGNLPPGNLAAIRQARLTCRQPAPTHGGEDAETLEAARRRITGVLRHQNRCVTAGDYQALALDTPAADVARAEVLPRFRPFQRRPDSPGTVSVLVLPPKPVRRPPNPRPDRNLVERVKAHLDPRRPLATELYAIGPEYRPLALTVAVGIREGAAREEVVKAVRQSLFDYLWPLPPGGRDGGGWPLGQSVVNLELEVIVARVAGVRTTQGLRLFRREAAGFRPLPAEPGGGVQRLALEPWQLPELLQVDVAVDAAAAPAELEDAGPAGAGGRVAIPVVPEVC